MSRYSDQFSKQPPPIHRFVVRARKGIDEREGVVRSRQEADTLAAKWHRAGYRVSIVAMHVAADPFDADVTIASAHQVPDDELREAIESVKEEPK